MDEDPQAHGCLKLQAARRRHNKPLRRRRLSLLIGAAAPIAAA